ncbi:unnamed protein product, partial [Choristocarpus tenellus]
DDRSQVGLCPLIQRTQRLRHPYCTMEYMDHALAESSCICKSKYRREVFQRHLSALYTCLVRTTSTCSARCMLPKPQPPPGEHMQCRGAVQPSKGGTAPQLCEVFCRFLPMLRAAEMTLLQSPSTTKDNQDPLLHTPTTQLMDILGLMYQGFEISLSRGSMMTGRQMPRTTPVYRRHAGLVPLLSPVVDCADGAILMFECLPLRLTSLTYFTGGFHKGSGKNPLLPMPGLGAGPAGVDLVFRFVFYQLLHTVNFLHEQGLAMGNLTSSNVMLSDRLWVYILPSLVQEYGCHDNEERGQKEKASQVQGPRQVQAHGGDHEPADLSLPPFSQSGSGRGSSSNTALGCPRPPPGHEYPLTYRWTRGWETNLSYLMAINAAAGRRPGDSACHPFVPWASDFTVRVG